MPDVVIKALKFGAGVFLALAFIALCVNLFMPATDASKTAQTDFSNTTTELKDQKYLIYDQTVVSGSQVLNAIRRFEKEGKAQTIGIYVQTGKNNGAGNWYYSQYNGTNVVSSTIQDATGANTVTDNNYINPTGTFKAAVQRDANNVIRAIKFVQE